MKTKIESLQANAHLSPQEGLAYLKGCAERCLDNGVNVEAAWFVQLPDRLIVVPCAQFGKEIWSKLGFGFASIGSVEWIAFLGESWTAMVDDKVLAYMAMFPNTCVSELPEDLRKEAVVIDVESRDLRKWFSYGLIEDKKITSWDDQYLGPEDNIRKARMHGGLCNWFEVAAGEDVTDASEVMREIVKKRAEVG